MAWDAGNPANDELLTNFPAQARANWDALALATDAALLITNAKCSDSMGLVDTKLAQIVTPAKVSGTAFVLLPNVPAGAGVLPAANSPNKLKADASDTTPQYLDSLIDTNHFQISAGDLLQLKESYVKTTGNESIDGIKTFTSSPKTDGISEKTPGTGVTVDGCLIKDGVVGNTDMVDSIHASDTPTADKLYPLGAGGKFPLSVISSLSCICAVLGQHFGDQLFTSKLLATCYFIKNDETHFDFSIFAYETAGGSGNHGNFHIKIGDDTVYTHVFLADETEYEEFTGGSDISGLAAGSHIVRLYGHKQDFGNVYIKKFISGIHK